MKNVIKAGLLTLLAVLTVFISFHAGAAVHGILTAGGASLASGGLIISPSRKRMIYSKLQNQFGRDLVIQESFLRVDNPIATNSNLWNFNISSSTSNAWENRLNKNDVFCVTGMGVFIYRSISTTGQAREVLQTYPNPDYFADGTNFHSVALETVYNGKLSIKVGTTVFLESFDTKRFRFVPQMPQGTVTGVYSTGPVYKTVANSNFKFGEGMVECDPSIYLNGDGQNDISLNIPLGSSDIIVSDVSNATNYLTFYAIGFLVKNGAAYWNQAMSSQG